MFKQIGKCSEGDGAMKRSLLGFCCSLALFAGAQSAFATEPAADREMAERYARAAQAGDDRAQFYLGALYSAGVGRPQSDTEAFAWISRAAQQGHTQAMLVLGGMLAIGRGAPVDNVAAYKWAYIVAEASRVFDLRNGARQLVALLETRMTAAEITQAKSDALRFRATGLNSPAANDMTSTLVPHLPPHPAPSLLQAAPAKVSEPAPTSAPQPAPAPSSRRPSAIVERVAPALKNDPSDIDRLLDRVPPSIRKRYGF